jgi:RNA polymerase sigma factor (sigma-70 family)
VALSDAELVRMAQGGDATSLGILLERHRTPLHALALQMLGGHAPQAQDAVQDAFLIALRNIDQLREPEAVGRWLRAILRNVCLERFRHHRGEILFDELAGRFEQEPYEPSAEEAIDRLALRDWVWTAFSELPEPLRVTAMLRYFGSYSTYEELSAILGVPLGTVRSRLSRVKAKLADALLKTAGLEHDEARDLAEARARFFAEAVDELNRRQSHEMFTGVFSDDLVMAFSDGTVSHGRAVLVAELEGDLEAGIKLHPTNVLASKGTTVMEGDFENPPDDPFHCPPATSMVFFHRDGAIHQVRRYFAPRPQKGHHDRRGE